MRKIPVVPLTLLVSQLALLTACGGGGGSSTSTPAPTPSNPTTTSQVVVSTPSSPQPNPIQQPESSTSTQDPEGQMTTASASNSTITTSQGRLADTKASGSGSLTSTAQSRPIHLSEFGIDLSRFANPDKAYVSLFVAASDWIGEQSAESRQFLLSNLSTASALDAANQIQVNLPLSVQYISVAIFDRTQTITARIKL